MAITADLFEVLDDPADSVVDCHVDLFVPAANGGGATFGISLLVAREGLPSPYTWADLAARCTALLDTLGIAVTE